METMRDYGKMTPLQAAGCVRERRRNLEESRRLTDTPGAIVATARKLFELRGVRATPIAAIAKEANVTRELIYYHFANRNGLIEAVIGDFQVFGFALWEGGVVENLWTISGPWNIMNGIAGILNIITICGWFGIFISKDPSKDMIWPDMIWAWIIAYDLWNFAYTYNCISDHSAYCGLALLLACTIPTFFIKRGAWLQHRAQTLALWIMFVMTVPQFADVLAPIPTTHNPTAFFVVSLLALASNVALAAYQLYRIRKLKLNPLKDQIYAGTKAYRRIAEENE